VTILNKILLPITVLIITSTQTAKKPEQLKEAPPMGQLELKRGDILVKPNHNWLPGSSTVVGGYSFGHVAIVLEGASGEEPEEVLKRTVIFESVARDIDEAYQLRRAFAYDKSSDPNKRNINFSNLHEGYRYVLRPGLDEANIDSLINWILARDGGTSSWRALKNSTTGINKNHWYCSLLIWQAFNDLFEIDLDVNGGQIVYPNDLINSDYFNKSSSEKFRF
jgi:hypothetical protein